MVVVVGVLAACIPATERPPRAVIWCPLLFPSAVLSPLVCLPVLYTVCAHQHVAASEDSAQRHNFSETSEDDLMGDGA